MLSHKPPGLERVPAEPPPRPALSIHKSRIPIKSEAASLKDRATPSGRHGLRGTPSPIKSSNDVYQETEGPFRGVNTTNQPSYSRNIHSVSPGHQSSVFGDLGTQLGQPRGLAIRHSTVDRQENVSNLIGNTENLSTDAHEAEGIRDLQEIQNDLQLQAERANTSRRQLPSLSAEHSEDLYALEQQPCPAAMSSRQDAGISGRIVPELRSLISIAQPDYVQPTTPNLPSTATPSTRYSESPGFWSSRNTTPMSMSSYSPGLVQSISPKQRFTSPRSGQSSSWLRKPQDARSPEPFDPSKYPGRNETTLSAGPVISTPPSSQVVEGLHLEKKRTKKGDPPPITPPPRKSSTKFSSPHKSLKGSKKPAKVAQSTDASSIPQEDALRFTRETQNQHTPERPSRDGVVFLSDNHTSSSPPVQNHVGQFYSNVSISSGQVFPGPPDSRLEPDQPSLRHAGQMIPDLGPPLRSPVSNAERIASRAGSKTSLANSEDSRYTIGGQQAYQGGQVGSPQRVTAEKKASRFGFWDKKMRSKNKATRGKRLSVGGPQTQRGTSTSTSNSASASVTSLRTNASSGAESEMDDFLSQRLEPIILRGGGGPLGSHPNLSTDSHADKSKLSHSEIRGAQQSALSSSNVGYRSPEKSIALSTSSTNDSIITDYSDHRSRNFLTPASEASTITKALRPTAQEKKPKASRWNIFSKNKKLFKGTTEAEAPPKMSVAVAPVPDARPLAFYAMDDPESDIEEAGMYDDMFEQGHRLSWAVADPSPNFREAPRRQLRRQQGFSILLPSPPVKPSEFQRPPSPRVFFQQRDPARSTDQNTWPSPTHQLRSMQVSQAPIVSPDHGQQIPSNVRSFSRPFGQDDVPPRLEASSNQPLTFVDSSLDGTDTYRTLYRRSQTVPPYHSEARQHVSQPEVWDPSIGHGLFDYSPRTASEIPAPLTPKTQTHASTGARIRQDEVWREYDDLIDHVLSPINSLKDTGVSFSQVDELPRHWMVGNEYRDNFIDDMPAPLSLKPVRPAYTTGHDSFSPLSSRESALVMPISASSNPSTLFPPLVNSNSSESVRLRRSRITSALRSSTTPSEPLSDPGHAETDEIGSVSNLHRRPQDDVDQHDGDTSSVLDLDNIPEAAENISHQLNTTMLDIAERDRDGPIALSNLRYGALMTSRWLSFGRVLFSPAHDRLQNSVSDRILVIDGLGNDDWSFYCALTYPNATTYNLSGRDPFLTQRPGNSDWKTPINHRNVNHANLSEPFPFPRSFFTVIVFRYPVAMPEQTLKTAISECKRVLQPGGFLELSVIDLDMVNMGNRTRRAVRMLKTRMSVADPSVCLKPAVDNIQRLIGRRGFENLNRCIVGLPVAGAVGSLGSESSRASNRSSGDRFSDVGAVAGSPHPSRNTKGINRARMSDQNFSLSDLLADHSSAGDEKLADVIAKVGRHFFSRCYEWAVLPNGDLERSLWSERAVLRECERRGSSFKLMIAYAQNPAEDRRRTLSEPAKPAPAIVGTTMMREYDNLVRR